jgi:toxin ParE1/3/4
MNSRYEVLWTNAAENDLKDIVEYIAEEDRLQTALKIVKQIRKKAQNLYTLPERGRIVPELQEQGIFQYREIVVSPWRLIYRIVERKIFVLSVIDSRRNVEDILLRRIVF